MENVVQIVINKKGRYYGNLQHYFRVIWHSPNIVVPYHNIRHMLHVPWAVYQGGVYYPELIDKVTFRNMLIAALFHDYNHSGDKGDDAKNIQAAINGLRAHILPVDEPYFEEICSYIRATQFPHTPGEVSLPAQILRDADISYTLGDVWIQTVNFGLSKEIGLSVEEMLRGQENFLKNVMKFSTAWANSQFGPKIADRIEEANSMVQILYGK